MTFDTAVVSFGLPIILMGLLHTIFYCAVSITAGFFLGTAVALSRLSRHLFLQWPALAFVELFRNTPFLVQAFSIYFILPRLGLRLEAPAAGILALTLYAGAVFSESVRGAILSVPKGQMQAARALGMPHFH